VTRLAVLFGWLGITLLLAGCGQGDRAQVRAVIEKLDNEQEQAFQTNSARLMEDSSTAQNLAAMVQNNDALTAAGASAIHLAKLEWGPVNVSNDTATAITWETWDTDFKDGSITSIRQENDYRLVKIGGVWMVDADNHPANQATPSPAAGAPASAPAPRATPAGAQRPKGT